ncbi:AAA domain-containing protein [Oceanobacillus halotolerans]|uniref:AAA domain-containing protein n=1 Tax=Oceanobacillus halotolerans TaxID=2663380 RepID=UPI0013D9653B|nr:AAA domain-containing protein [Oceanobacillus halotolerans]
MALIDSTKVTQLFEYLLAVKQLNEQVIRNVRDYEKVWWQSDIPNVEGCYLGGNGQMEEAWLEVHKQTIKPPPAIPRMLDQWLEKWDDPDQEPSPIPQIEKGIDSDTGEVLIEMFEDTPERTEVYEQWFREEWKPWSLEASPKRKIQHIYDELFSLYQRLQREGDELELNWGHGLLSWHIEGEKIQRHMLVTNMELQFNAQKGIFYLLPTSKGVDMEADMFQNIAIPNASRLYEMESEVDGMELSLWDQEGIASLYKEIVHTISPKGTYQEDDTVKKIPSDPLIQHKPAIFLRKNSGRLWDMELTDAIEKMKEGYPIPKTITNLTTNDPEHGNELDVKWHSVGEELLFPLPANYEQKQIAKKLATNEGVLVQGPPGTGKSHTIANLICHLLAHGKRVLITSEKERALEVLRDKIPEAVRALCVNVLGGDSRSVKEIEDSVKTIAENLDRKQPEALEKNIENLQAELDQTRRNMSKYNTQMNRSAELENSVLELDGEEFTPLEAAKWIKEHKTYHHIPDNLEPKTPFPLTEEATKEYFQLLEEIDAADKKALSNHRPKTELLPTPNQFEVNIDKIRAIEKEMNETKDEVNGWSPKENLTFDTTEMISFVDHVLDELRDISQSQWLSTIFQDIFTFDDKLQQWKQLYDEIADRVAELEDKERALIEEEIKVESTLNYKLVLEDLKKVEERLKQDKSVGWVFQNVTGRKYAYLFEQITINGLSIRNAKDAEHVRMFLERTELIRKLVLRWNRSVAEIEGPEMEENERRFSVTLKGYLQKLDTILQWKSNVINPLQKVLKEVNATSLANPDWTEAETYKTIQDGFIALQNQEAWEQANRFFKDTFVFLHEQKRQVNPHPSIDTLYEACQHRDDAAWKETYQELLRLEGLEGKYQTYLTYKETLGDVTPKWVEQLEEGTVHPPENVPQVWKYAQIRTWLVDIESHPKLEELEAAYDREQKRESDLIQELVAVSTWKSQIERTTTEQKRSLFAWLKAIQRIGKGTGKYANVYRKEASKEMKTARGAIPVWVMPINRVIENIELTNEQFDVVIVDESSQSTLFSLSALLRAEKAVIVGDDNQISPESVGTDISEVHELIERHLYNIPNKLQFEMKTSLYDTASRIFDSKIILKEHFRCVPEIIQFSNDFMYGGMIDPLRLPLANEVLEPPVKAVHVPDGYRKEDTRRVINEPEAEAIVHHIAQCCQDDHYNGKTMGVISLQGHDQARLIENLLREKIGEEEMIERQIICGDAYSFQGDERDVMFLSLVAAPNVRFTAMTKRSAQQRFNVAASRARDQMFLYHTVELNELNPDDVRYKLLQYCQNPHRVQLAVDEARSEFDSPFEEDVFRMIVARGYHVIPQVRVGTLGKRIDLVVEGMRNRLAVECDGDKWHGLDKWEEDMERQRILERVGWTFWRVRGSQFYMDREKAMAPLWEKLEEMGIEPVGKMSV